MFVPSLVRLAEASLADARNEDLRIATAESCTGGLIAALFTEIAGASDVFERGFVTYSNASKTQMLGVPAVLIDEHGAVSEAVVRVMAEGALRHSQAQLSVAVTGVAGPGGGTAQKPVGFVHIAVARIGHDTVHEQHNFGEIGRVAIRLRTVEAALRLLHRFFR